MYNVYEAEFKTFNFVQPARYRDRSNEVFLDFEAFLLSSMRERSTLWIHSQVTNANHIFN